MKKLIILMSVLIMLVPTFLFAQKHKFNLGGSGVDVISDTTGKSFARGTLYLLTSDNNLYYGDGTSFVQIGTLASGDSTFTKLFADSIGGATRDSVYLVSDVILNQNILFEETSTYKTYYLNAAGDTIITLDPAFGIVCSDSAYIDTLTTTALNINGAQIRSNTTNNTLFVGQNSGASNTGAESNGFGGYALQVNTGAGSNGFGYAALQVNTGAYSNGVGSYALRNNTGTYSNGFGYFALNSNTGTKSNGFGSYALQSNTGEYSNGVGSYALRNNTGAYSTGVGSYVLQYNAGIYSNGFGSYVLQYNTGTSSNGVGYYTLQYNTGAYSNGFGDHALQYNEGTQNTGVGGESFNSFTEDAGSAQTFASTDVIADGDTIVISSHGFGSADTYVNLKWTATTGALPTGISLNQIDQFYIAHADSIVLETDDMTTQGSGNHTLTPQTVYTNSTAIGYNAEPDASNQVMLGDGNVTEVKTAGKITASNYEATNKLTACATNAGALDFSAGSKTLTVADNATIGLDLNALEGLSSAGLVARTAANTYSERTITGTANQIAITNGDGVSGNPTIAFTATPILPDGTTATTQSAGDNSTKVATTAYADAAGAAPSGNNNEILTDDGGGGIVSESGLTYDGSTLGVSGNISLSGGDNIYGANSMDIYTTGPNDDILIDPNSGGIAVTQIGVDGDNDTTKVYGTLIVEDATQYVKVVSLADGAQHLLPTGVAGFGKVHCNGECATFYFSVDGAVSLVTAGTAGLSSANVGTTEDNDGTLNIFDDGSGIGIENELGDTYNVLIDITYYTP